MVSIEGRSEDEVEVAESNRCLEEAIDATKDSNCDGVTGWGRLMQEEAATMLEGEAGDGDKLDVGDELQFSFL